MTRTDVTYEIVTRSGQGEWRLFDEFRSKSAAERGLRYDAEWGPESDWMLLRVERRELKVVPAKKEGEDQ